MTRAGTRAQAPLQEGSVAKVGQVESRCYGSAAEEEKPPWANHRSELPPGTCKQPSTVCTWRVGGKGNVISAPRKTGGLKSHGGVGKDGGQRDV